jgi:deazaflavin-dependent oxidoreductase (nitroreductase family)
MMAMVQKFHMTPMMRMGTMLLKLLLWAGMPMGSLALLSVRGRTSGKVYTTPVALVQQDHEQWLVAAFEEVNWVRNLRAAGSAHLIRGRHTEAIEVIELEMSKAAPILQVFLERYQRVPFIPPYFSVTSPSSRAAFEREAIHHPLFRIVPVNAMRRNQAHNVVRPV